MIINSNYVQEHNKHTHTQTYTIYTHHAHSFILIDPIDCMCNRETKNYIEEITLTAFARTGWCIM